MRKKATNELETIAERIRDFFSTKDTAREKVIKLCREVIRCSANAIRAVHRQDQAEAKELLESAQNSLRQIAQSVPREHNDLLYGGLIHDAQKELAEASVTLALVAGDTIPTPEAAGVTYAAYLNGMGEAVGELRRYLLDSLRHDDLSRCEELLATMDDIYSILVTMDFPDAITFGLRRTTDSVRGILERTRGDLTLVLRQKTLEDKLKSI